MDYPSTCLSTKEWSTAWEVYEQYDISESDKSVFVSSLIDRAKDTSYPFDAYRVAHHICAAISTGRDIIFD